MNIKKYKMNKSKIKWWLKYHEYQGNFDEKSNEILNELNNINFKDYEWKI